jgi:threonine synthase
MRALRARIQPGRGRVLLSACGYHDGILDAQYDYESLRKVLNHASLAANPDLSMWRYLPLLPVQDGVFDSGSARRLDSALRCSQAGRRTRRRPCWVKDEGRNPTASFKDRASAIGVVKALEQRAERITCASTGNAASSLAGFAAAAGIPSTIFVPARAPEAKVAQLLVYGAQVFCVQGTYDEAWELCMQASAEFGWYNRNCAINPYLIEGKKTVTLELIEQCATVTPGSYPDWVVVSVGDGCTIAGAWKGLREMHLLGLLPRLPRLLGVQADGCQPFVTAWRTHTALAPCQPTPWPTPSPSDIRGTSARPWTRSWSPAAHSSPSPTRKSSTPFPCSPAKPGSLASPRASPVWPGSSARWRRASFAPIGIRRHHHDRQWTQRHSERNPLSGRAISVRPEMEEVRNAVARTIAV